MILSNVYQTANEIISEKNSQIRELRKFHEIDIAKIKRLESELEAIYEMANVGGGK